MKVANYLEQCGLETTVLHALEKMGVRGDIQVDILNALYDFTLKINTRAKSRFGQVNYTKKVIELTSEFFESGLTVFTDRKDKHNNTLLHEVAHLIVRILFPYSKGHGTHWQRVMRALGQKAERTGNDEFLHTAIQKKKAKLSHKHEYRCLGCNFTYKTQRVLVRVESRYHATCGQERGRLEHTQVR